MAGGWGFLRRSFGVAVWSPQRCLCSSSRRTLKCQALEGVGGEREGSVPARTFRRQTRLGQLGPVPGPRDRTTPGPGI